LILKSDIKIKGRTVAVQLFLRWIFVKKWF